MRNLGWVSICTLLLLQAIPMVSAQAQLPPPNYSLICDSQVWMDVDPETSTPPSEVIDCVVSNEQSYSLELSISSEISVLSVKHDDSIVVGANSEETFQVTVDAEDRMLVSAFQLTVSTEVTKTGEMDYSDDEPKTSNVLIQIAQYAAFSLEPQQEENDQKLMDDEYFKISYIMTNNGNEMDKFTINTYSFATPICDEDQTLESSNSEASGCVLMTPVSNDCSEKLTVKMMEGQSGDWQEGKSMSRIVEVGQSFSLTFKLSVSVDNATCWPKDYNGNYNLEFTHIVRAFSEFGMNGWYDGDDDWGQYDHSPMRIERIVDVTISSEEATNSSEVPGFESSYLLLCVFLAVIIHNRKGTLY